MKTGKQSKVLPAGLLISCFVFAGNVMAGSLRVETINHPNKIWKAEECSRGCNDFILAVMPVFLSVPQPSSGTATLSAYFVDISSAAPPVSCSRLYSVSTASAAVVNVRQAGCSITIQKK